MVFDVSWPEWAQGDGEAGYQEGDDHTGVEDGVVRHPDPELPLFPFLLGQVEQLAHGIRVLDEGRDWDAHVLWRVWNVEPADASC